MPDQNQSSDPYEYYDDPLYLSSSDQPFSQLTASLFDGTDFLSWKQDILMALAAKNKDGFINSTLLKPASTDKKFHQFIRCDLMVLKWILNSIDKPLRENPKYIRTAKELWDEIMERYGQSNFIEIYQLTQELNSATQYNASIIEYYSKVINLWETLESLDPVPGCSCGKLASCTCTLLKRMHARDQQAKLIKFLMGLNSGYDTVRTQILSMDHLPSLSKVLGLLQKIEKQKHLTDVVENLSDVNAYTSYKPSDVSHKFHKSGSQSDNNDPPKYCSHCKMNNHNLDDCFWVNKCTSCGKIGHSVDKCFHVVGFPNKNTKGNGKMPYNKHGHNPNVKKTANNVDTLEDFSPLGNDDGAGTSQTQPVQSMSFDSSMIDGLVISVVDQVLQRIYDSKPGLSSSNFAGILHYAHSATSNLFLNDWIIDTGAFDHMTYNINLMHNKTILKVPILIGLPDGTTKVVKIIGDVLLTPAITLKNVLLIADFRQNLLSNHSSNKCVATGKRVGDLYRFQTADTQSLVQKIAAA
ncbi:uncharacterized protein LOC141648673 [Silene latifolia]|uniref:uncharacterized protein LOC141648673 n=1 Tax=Silene latifolia TaxID=37657 RepID=UPI003D785815